MLLSMGWMDGLMVLSEGRKAEADQRLWEQYLTVYPLMTEENFISFSTFKGDSGGKPTKIPQTKDDIMTNVKAIINLTIER